MAFLYENKKFTGKKIKEIRKKSKLSQAELSEIIGMTEKNLSNIERGLQVPSLISFLKILDIFHLELKDFEENTEENERIKKEKLINEISESSPDEIDVFMSILNYIKRPH